MGSDPVYLKLLPQGDQLCGSSIITTAAANATNILLLGAFRALEERILRCLVVGRKGHSTEPVP